MSGPKVIKRTVPLPHPRIEIVTPDIADEEVSRKFVHAMALWLSDGTYAMNRCPKGRPVLGFTSRPFGPEGPICVDIVSQIVKPTHRMRVRRALEKSGVLLEHADVRYEINGEATGTWRVKADLILPPSKIKALKRFRLRTFRLERTSVGGWVSRSV